MNLQRSYFKESVVDLGVSANHVIVGAIFQIAKNPDQPMLTNTIEYAKATLLGNKVIKKNFFDSFYDPSNDLISLDLSAAWCLQVLKVSINQ